MRQTVLRLAVALLLGAAAVPAAPQSWADRLQADAVKLFRAGRFPAAYGRFVALADVGQPVAARYALWMCQQGPELFGSDWDCSPDQQRDWSQLASVPAPAPPARRQGQNATETARSRAR